MQLYFDPDIVRHAVHHHERLNSSGYPEQLHSGNLDVIDRIIQVADVTSALAMNRSYKDAYETSKVIEILDNLVKSGELDKNCVEIIERRFLNPLKNQTQQQPE